MNTISQTNTEESKPQIHINIRPANENDISFILNSWLKSYRNSHLCSDIPNDIYFIEHHKLIRRIIQQYPVFVACCVDDPELLYGWVCAGKIEDIWCAHYVYIKQAFRKLGIAKLLLQASGYKENCAGLCTHRTAKTLPLEHSMGLIYDPYILINHLAQEIEYVEQQASK